MGDYSKKAFGSADDKGLPMSVVVNIVALRFIEAGYGWLPADPAGCD